MNTQLSSRTLAPTSIASSHPSPLKDSRKFPITNAASDSLTAASSQLPPESPPGKSHPVYPHSPRLGVHSAHRPRTYPAQCCTSVSSPRFMCEGELPMT